MSTLYESHRKYLVVSQFCGIGELKNRLKINIKIYNQFISVLQKNCEIINFMKEKKFRKFEF